MYPTECRYSKEHEWVRLDEGGQASVGITYYAQKQLGDVVYVDLPPVGTRLLQFQKFGEVESVKSVSDLFSPVSGEVVAVNQEMADKPELVNKEPYGGGWLIRVALKDAAELEKLLTSQEYQGLVEQEAH
ncbi:MAG: glycine cleavage system protein GcvH [Chloroflexi bacterium]|nr:glycine cleavage system protein GcvH [Chloroflexota bacterium]